MFDNDLDEDGEKYLGDYFSSDEFKKKMRKAVEDDTWGFGLPMVYLNDKGEIVREWKDGLMEIRINDDWVKYK